MSLVFRERQLSDEARSICQIFIVGLLQLSSKSLRAIKFVVFMTDVALEGDLIVKFSDCRVGNVVGSVVLF